MRRAAISLLITDLDNTVYDWLSAFVPAFYVMVAIAAPLIRISEDQLLDELQRVHQTHADSEHPFALLETQSIRDRFGTRTQQELLEHFDPAFHAFNRTRKERLKLYDGVYETLRKLSSKIPIVAYTDARVINCLFRLERLGVRPFFSKLYAPAHLELQLEASIAESEFVRLLAPTDRKPNPQTLRDICADFETSTSEALYVGDSLVRDIFMARDAGLHSAWARYGTIYDKELWPKLVRVTHWTAADVEREKALKEKAAGVLPDCVLETFEELTSHFEFVRRSG